MWIKPEPEAALEVTQSTASPISACQTWPGVLFKCRLSLGRCGVVPATRLLTKLPETAVTRPWSNRDLDECLFLKLEKLSPSKGKGHVQHRGHLGNIRLEGWNCLEKAII